MKSTEIEKEGQIETCTNEKENDTTEKRNDTTEKDTNLETLDRTVTGWSREIVWNGIGIRMLEIIGARIGVMTAGIGIMTEGRERTGGNRGRKMAGFEFSYF